MRNVFTLVIALFFLLGSATLLRAQNNALAIFSALEKGKAIKLMSRREIEETLFHAGLVQGDNPETVLKAGKALGISFILFGQVTKKDGKIQANFKLMDIQDKRVIKIWFPTFSGREAILAQMPSLAGKISKAILSRERFKSATFAEETRLAINIENLKARSHGKKVVLTWKFDNSLPIVGFNVYHSENQKGPYQFLGRTNNNIFNDTKIKKGKSYYYHVGIILSSGQEIKTKHTAQLKHVGEKKPHPPLILGGRGHVKRVEIKFVPSLLNEQEKFKITKYKIYRQKIPDDN
jgi:TolB-like protein